MHRIGIKSVCYLPEIQYHGRILPMHIKFIPHLLNFSYDKTSYTHDRKTLLNTVHFESLNLYFILKLERVCLLLEKCAKIT